MKTLVVPEGGELPPEEELAAMEAAEAEVQAAAQAEAEAHRAEAEAALEVELEDEPEAPAQTPAEAAAEQDERRRRPSRAARAPSRAEVAPEQPEETERRQFSTACSTGLWSTLELPALSGEAACPLWTESVRTAVR